MVGFRWRLGVDPLWQSDKVHRATRAVPAAGKATATGKESAQVPLCSVHWDSSARGWSGFRQRRQKERTYHLGMFHPPGTRSLDDRSSHVQSGAKVNLLKGEATKQLKKENLHPLAEHVESDGRMPSPWAHREWKVYLDSEEAIEDAIWYVEENPQKEGKPRQDWSFVTPFAGLDKGWVTYH